MAKEITYQLDEQGEPYAVVEVRLQSLQKIVTELENKMDLFEKLIESKPDSERFDAKLEAFTEALEIVKIALGSEI
jgi:septation ring formation regulator EzrA